MDGTVGCNSGYDVSLSVSLTPSLSLSLSLLLALAFFEVSSPLWSQASSFVQVDKIPGLHGNT